MEPLKIIPVNIPERLEEIISISWFIFTNQYINQKYDINLEAPFQLHFATILKQLGDVYCLKSKETFLVNLETNMLLEKNNYIDIAVSIFDLNNDNEYCIPIELKYKTLRQSAEDIGVMEIYKDIKCLEDICYNYKRDKLKIPFSYLFVITDNQRYVNKANSGLKTIYRTDDGYKIENGFDYKYLATKTGKEFYEKYGSFIFKGSYQFQWKQFIKNQNYKRWFLKLKVGTLVSG